MRQLDFSDISEALPVGVDLIRFEKNLLQIGFFGAHDTRHNNQSTRRIEQWVTREGQKTRVSAEFRGSALGLPSTSDRDKYIAFMKIAMDQRAKLGQLTNPIRFTGYQMLKELGMTFSGENYEDINRWGQRMADTSITSEQVIYLAARKKYANKTIHVFRSFVRTGKSNSDESGRAEYYEVVLEDWLLDNLNQSYVIPEDFNAYRCLKRPTAKGIFGYLHLLFHASQGRVVEKDYTDLCMLLNIPFYKHVSKIRETMGRSLDELAQIGYLQSWDIQPMATKQGFKLVLHAGEKLLHVLAISQRKTLAASEGNARPKRMAHKSRRKVLQELLDWGIAEAKAESLVRSTDADRLLEQIDYTRFLVEREGRKIDNPAGFLIYAIESRLPVPLSFVRSSQEKETTACEGEEYRTRLDESYGDYVTQWVQQELQVQFPGEELAKRLRLIIGNRLRTDKKFAEITPAMQKVLAEETLKQEILNSGATMTFEEWCASREQLNLFGGNQPGQNAL